jgi:hypothetical protein
MTPTQRRYFRLILIWTGLSVLADVLWVWDPPRGDFLGQDFIDLLLVDFFMEIAAWLLWLFLGLYLVVRAVRESIRASGVRAVALVLGAFALALAFQSAMKRLIVEHPRDATLLREFSAREREFEEMADLFAEEKVFGTVASDFVGSRSGGGLMADSLLTPGDRIRLAAYRARIAKLGIDGGVFHEGEGIRFTRSVRRHFFMDSYKGFVRRTEPPESVARSLDEEASLGHERTTYRRIKGDWYLFQTKPQSD